jgi:glucuronate isomerase
MKPRADSRIDGLPSNQRDALEGWLFEENISYQAAKSRLLDNFGLKTSMTAITVWFQKRAKVRMLARLQTSSLSKEMGALKLNPEDSYAALMGLIGQAALEAQMGAKELDLDTLKQLAELTRFGLEMKNRWPTVSIPRDNGAERREMAAARACLKHFRAIEMIIKDNAMDENGKLARIRSTLFGGGK